MQSSLTLIPPSLFGPPELVHVDMKDTDKTGVVFVDRGKGRVGWIPWDLGALYYAKVYRTRGALPDVIHHLNPHEQLQTTAHRLVEITWMKQDERQLLHLINLSGHSGPAIFPRCRCTISNTDAERSATHRASACRASCG